MKDQPSVAQATKELLNAIWGYGRAGTYEPLLDALIAAVRADCAAQAREQAREEFEAGMRAGRPIKLTPHGEHGRDDDAR
jgi:hypothetical protein